MTKNRSKKVEKTVSHMHPVKGFGAIGFVKSARYVNGQLLELCGLNRIINALQIDISIDVMNACIEWVYC